MISVVVASLNNEHTIKNVLRSLNEQTYKTFEVLFVDGGSTDNTCKFIREFIAQNEVIKASLVSEPDLGIYDALNKGIVRATGDYVCVLHSDDEFSSSYSISTIERELQHHEIDIFLFPIKVRSCASTFMYSVPKFVRFCMHFGHMPPHPGMVIKKEVFETVGYYNPNFKIAGDFDFFLRCLGSRVTYSTVKIPYYNMALGGISSKGLTSYLEISKEISAIYKTNGYRLPYLRAYSRALTKLIFGPLVPRIRSGIIKANK